MTAKRSLKELGLNRMVLAALAREGISTELQLREASRDTLSRIPGIGRVRLELIYKALDGNEELTKS